MLGFLTALYLWAGAALCGLGENRSELATDRCSSGYPHIALVGFVFLLGGLAAAKLLRKRWPAWAGIALTPVPGLVTLELLGV